MNSAVRNTEELVICEPNTLMFIPTHQYIEYTVKTGFSHWSSSEGSWYWVYLPLDHNDTTHRSLGFGMRKWWEYRLLGGYCDVAKKQNLELLVIPIRLLLWIIYQEYPVTYSTVRNTSVYYFREKNFFKWMHLISPQMPKHSYRSLAVLWS